MKKSRCFGSLIPFLLVATIALGQDTFLDDFNNVSYTNNGGSLNFAAGWTETNEGTSPTGGKIRIISNQLRLRNTDNRYITRTLDLNGATSATLTLDYDATNRGNENLNIQLWNTTTSSYQTIATINSSSTGSISHNLTTDQMSSSSAIRFRGVDTSWSSSEEIFIDNVLFTATFAVTTDSDGDGVYDQSDLDDDNDGIPDFDELSSVASTGQPSCGGETTLDFSSAATLVSGSPLTQGAVYRIANVTTGTDALVTIVTTFNVSVANIDNNSEDPQSFKPQTAFNFPNIGDQGYVEYNIQFVNSGGSTPVVIPKFFMNFNDIDGGANYAEQNWADNPATYTTENPTELTMTTDGSWVIGTAGPNDYGGAGNGNPQVNFSVNYNSKSQIDIRVGAVARVPGASSGGRQHAIEFACITNYANPITYGIDTDSDGIANHLDLDADNDGIYDAVEAGHNRVHLNGVVISTFGANGLADLVETLPESGTINYTISDTDTTPPPDFLDTDSDDDGCSDANEAYANSNADGGDDEYFGLGSPPPVDANGRVLAAPYTVPADTGSNGTQDHLEALLPAISAQPTDSDICLGCNTTFSVVASDVTTYQWQVFNGSVWVDLTDTGIYSGTSTDTLVITNAGAAENGNQYRVLLSNLNFICGPVISNSAILTVSVNSVITNRRITIRANKN